MKTLATMSVSLIAAATIACSIFATVQILDDLLRVIGA